MRNRVRRLLPHAAILICNMYVVFYLIDRVNTAMNFIDNRLTKGLLILLAVVTFFNCRELLRMDAAAGRRPAGNPPRRAPQAANRGGGASPRPRNSQYGGGQTDRRYAGERDGRYRSDTQPRPAYRRPSGTQNRGGRV